MIHCKIVQMKIILNWFHLSFITYNISLFVRKKGKFFFGHSLQAVLHATCEESRRTSQMMPKLTGVIIVIVELTFIFCNFISGEPFYCSIGQINGLFRFLDLPIYSWASCDADYLIYSSFNPPHNE